MIILLPVAILITNRYCWKIQRVFIINFNSDISFIIIVGIYSPGNKQAKCHYCTTNQEQPNNSVMWIE